jgi:ribonucleoside-triphosphate reductase
LENWILTPNEIIHDIRYFLKNSLHGMLPPDSFEAALTLVRQVLEIGGGEVSGEQTLEFFNTFLSPYVRGRTAGDISNGLYYFLTSMRRDIPSGSPQAGISISVDLIAPEFILQEDAIGLGGKAAGKYSDYGEESRLLAAATIEAFQKMSQSRPPILPHLLVRVRRKTLSDERARAILEKAHELSVQRSIPMFQLSGDGEKSSYSATGLRLGDEWTNHWDADCVRTGSMDTIFLNLPRIAYQAKKNDEKFSALLRETVSLTVEGFKVKKKFVNERMKQPLLHLLAGESGTAPYFYEKNSSYNLSFIGLNEAVEDHTGLKMERDRAAADFGLKIIQEISKLLKSASEESEMRITASQRPGDEAAGRLAELDIEQYGRAAIVADGSRGLFYYTDLQTIPLTTKMAIDSRLDLESRFQSVTPGGHLSLVCISPESTAPALMRLTEKAFDSGCKFLVYTSNYSACSVCNHTDPGITPKCSKCGSDKITYLGRSSYGLLPFSLWPEAKRRSVERRVSYTVST